jgi:hypothetical protein
MMITRTLAINKIKALFHLGKVVTLRKFPISQCKIYHASKSAPRAEQSDKFKREEKSRVAPICLLLQSSPHLPAEPIDLIQQQEGSGQEA